MILLIGDVAWNQEDNGTQSLQNLVEYWLVKMYENFYYLKYSSYRALNKTSVH